MRIPPLGGGKPPLKKGILMLKVTGPFLVEKNLFQRWSN